VEFRSLPRRQTSCHDHHRIHRNHQPPRLPKRRRKKNNHIIGASRDNDKDCQEKKTKTSKASVPKPKTLFVVSDDEDENIDDNETAADDWYGWYDGWETAGMDADDDDDEWGTWTAEGRKHKTPVPEPKLPPRRQPMLPPTKRQYDLQKKGTTPQQKPQHKMVPSPKKMPDKPRGSQIKIAIGSKANPIGGKINTSSSSSDDIAADDNSGVMASTAKALLADWDSVGDDIVDELGAQWSGRGGIDKPTTGMAQRLRDQNNGKTQRGTHPRAGRKIQKQGVKQLLVTIATST
jgi:hypothetical protein